MMICPETFYEMRLKGKTKEEIVTVIRSLKREITKLKNTIEHPDYKYREWAIQPGEDVQLYMNREYLERAIKAYEETGGEYMPSKEEQKSINFDADVQNIKKIVFSIGGFFGGYKTKTYTVNGEKINVEVTHTFKEKLSDDECNLKEINKEYFLNSLEELHIGEWRKVYNTYRFGVAVMDGTSWNLEIYFSNGRRAVKIHGSNAYPYNFDRLLDLFAIDDIEL